MKIAVTGANGHIGACLVRELLVHNHEVTAMLYQDDTALKGLNINLVEGDILRPDSLDSIIAEQDIVYHLAAQISIDRKDENTVYEVNFEGSKNVISACKRHKVKRLIHFSSVHAMVSLPLSSPFDETRPLVTSERFIYDRSKADTQRFIQENNHGDLEIIILNPTAVVGPYDFKPSYLGQAIMDLHTGKLPMLVKGGYNFVDVRDVCKSAVNALTKGENKEHYLLSGEYYSMKNLAHLMNEELKSSAPTFICPDIIARMGLPFISLYARITKKHPLYTSESLDILKECNPNMMNQKARKSLGHNPRPISETLTDSIRWYEENGFI